MPFTSRYAHGDRLDIGGAPLRLKVNTRASRVSLRVDSARREVVATAPSARRLKEAVEFAGQRLAWIRAQLAVIPDVLRLQPGAVIEVLGRSCRLQVADRRADQGLFDEAEGGLRLAVMGEGDIYGTRAIRLLRAHAQAVFSERTRFYAERLGQPAPPVALTDAKSRWGSCKPARPGHGASIRYSWRLVLAPFAVADYVVAHECAHLLEANHGPRFWAIVRDQFGSEKAARAWLRQNGARLQAVGR